MPCSLCGNAGHNRRRCQRWDMLIATRIQESNLNNVSTPATPLPTQPPDMSEITPIRNYSDISTNLAIHDFNTPTDHNNNNDITYTPSTPTTRFPLTLFTDGDSIQRELWSDSDDDTQLDLSLNYSSESNLKSISHNKPLVEIAEHPCHTNDCPICMDDLLQTDLFVTRCGHQFHGTCMIRHIKHNDTCPMCRGVLFASSCAS